MLWAFLAAAGSGFAIGLRFRVTALLAAALILTLATTAAGVRLGWSGRHTIAVLLLLLATQQGLYLIGLFASLRGGFFAGGSKKPSSSGGADREH